LQIDWLIAQALQGAGKISRQRALFFVENIAFLMRMARRQRIKYQKHGIYSLNISTR